MKELGLSIKTTSRCQKMCKDCSVVPWMKANPGFHTSTDQIRQLINYSKESSYHWNYILLSGGEPLLWHNIYEGIKLLYESGICSRLVILSNGLEIKTKSLRAIEALFPHIHELRISRYDDNAENIRLAQEYFGKFKNDYGESQLTVVDRQEHLIPPDKPVPDSLPAKCVCKAYAMVGNNIDLCGPARTLKEKIGTTIDLTAAAGYNGINFLEPLFHMEKMGIRFNREECKYCISNYKVANHLKKEQA